MSRYFTLLLALLGGCTGVPDGLTPVDNFDANRYLGTWYEIARLDHRFERGLEQVSAHYSLNPDGSIKVINRGYDPEQRQWQQAEGTAKFVGEPTIGQLKVSFFGPFYGGYNVLQLAPDYRYALISGPDRDYLWILARSASLPEQDLKFLVAEAKRMGFATEQLIYVHHLP
ncbi:MAG: lipocalin family protein [Aeromonadaceae bacterium]|nr:lipocalin family protein [Aeromonadaceae bacterium]MBP9569824.1 lipocalin family protein [Aeromonadaceae bacterium]